jgi:hypothetical protein
MCSASIRETLDKSSLLEMLVKIKLGQGNRIKERKAIKAPPFPLL